MKFIATLLLLIYLRCANAEEEVYDTKYDGVDLEEILTNDRLRNNYIKCLLDLGPCSPDAKELKSKHLVWYRFLSSNQYDHHHQPINILTAGEVELTTAGVNEFWSGDRVSVNVV
jgi:hypothetical protein